MIPVVPQSRVWQVRCEVAATPFSGNFDAKLGAPVGRIVYGWPNDTTGINHRWMRNYQSHIDLPEWSEPSYYRERKTLVMNRSRMLLAALMPNSLFSAKRGTGRNPQMNSASEIHRQRAVQTNEFAGKVQSPSDSRRLVDMIAEMLADVLPPAWGTRTIRDRIAHAEYESATDPAKLVPEQRIMDAWNKYVAEIGASQQALVNVAEIHTLRDGYYTLARVLWRKGRQHIWTMPNIYAVGIDEKLADGCRAVETLRVVWDLANKFENLQGARDSIQKGVVSSDMFQQQLAAPTSNPVWCELRVQTGMRVKSPVEVAVERYIREHGATGLSHAIEGLIYDLFPPQTQA
jgi:hypothetical protein